MFFQFEYLIKKIIFFKRKKFINLYKNVGNIKFNKIFTIYYNKIKNLKKDVNKQKIINYILLINYNIKIDNFK